MVESLSTARIPDGTPPLAAAHCHGCAWTAAGTMADVDRAAAKHVAPGHPTATIAEPARRNT